jgi:hypothetical protein
MADEPTESTTRTGAKYPANTQDPSYIDHYIRRAVESLEKMVIPKYATQSARDTAIPSPVEGDACWLQDQDVLQIYAAGGWQQLWPSTQPTITHGTAAPTGGSDGDVYLQYA